jgi:hypothetical protein
MSPRSRWTRMVRCAGVDSGSSLRRRWSALGVGAAGGALVLVASGHAHGFEVEVTSSTTAQGYAVASPWGASLERRRLLQQAGFSLYGLGQDEWRDGPVFDVRVMLRVDADFGLGNQLDASLSGAETQSALASGGYYVPGLETAPADVLFAYVDMRNAAGGWLGGRFGRQYRVDTMGWWSFDGAAFRAMTPVHVAIDAYGGLEQRGGFPLSTSRFERPGVWRDRVAEADRSFVRDSYTSLIEPAHAPAFGLGAETIGLDWLQASLSYRRVYNSGDTTTGLFTSEAGEVEEVEGLRVSSDRIGAALGISDRSIGAIRGTVVYDLYVEQATGANATVEAYLRDGWTIAADFDHFVPSFDGDSIWNWFAREYSTTALGRCDMALSRRVDLSVRGGTKYWGVEESTPSEEDGALRSGSSEPVALESVRGIFDVLVDTTGRYRGGSRDLAVRTMVQTGERGHRIGTELQGEQRLDGGRIALGARVSVFDFGDAGQEARTPPLDRDSTTFGYALGSGFRPLESARFAFEWEHAMSELIGNRFRILGSVALDWGG